MNLLENIIGHNFNNVDLLKQALTHPSFNNGLKKDDYERLEFLGDSVLSLIITEYLIKNFPKESEGELAKRRSKLVCGETLTTIAKDIGIGEFIKFSKGEKDSGGGNKDSNLEDCVEALIGAIYLDGGFTKAQDFVIKNWRSIVINMREVPIDRKSSLQEWSQRNSLGLPIYNILKKSGPDHSVVFEVEVIINNKYNEKGFGSSKKSAERQAAQKLMEKINNE